MERIEVGGMIYEFEDGFSLLELLDEKADRVYEGISTEKTPPNDPLTLEQLMEMDEDYVYLVLPSGLGNRWAFVQVMSEGRSGTHLLYHDGASSAGFLLDCGAKFYHCEPEEGTT